MLLVFDPLTPCCHLDATKPRTHGKCLGAAFHVPSFAFVAHAFELEWALWPAYGVHSCRKIMKVCLAVDVVSMARSKAVCCTWSRKGRCAVIGSDT